MATIFQSQYIIYKLWGGGGNPIVAPDISRRYSYNIESISKNLNISNGSVIIESSHNDLQCDSNVNKNQSQQSKQEIPLESFYKTAIIIPCYNEEKTIAQVIDELFAAVPQAHICVFDNNSTDNSRSIVESKILECTPSPAPTQSGRDSKIKQAGNMGRKLSLYLVSTQGKGAVMREAFALIEADCYVMIDADTQYSSDFLPQALAYFQANKLDMLNIARKGDSDIYRPGHSFGNKLFSKSTQMLFGTKINDMLSGYRIFSRPFVKSFPAHSNGFEIETELTIYALQQRLRTDEIAAPYKSRPEGSFSKLSTFKDGFKISLMILNLLFSERPLLVFGLCGTLCFMLAFIFSLPIVFEFLETSRVARFPTLFVCVGLMVIGVVLCIAGLLAYLVTKGIKEARYLAYLQSSRDTKATLETKNIDCHADKSARNDTSILSHCEVKPKQSIQETKGK